MYVTSGNFAENSGNFLIFPDLCRCSVVCCHICCVIFASDKALTQHKLRCHDSFKLIQMQHRAQGRRLHSTSDSGRMDKAAPWFECQHLGCGRVFSEHSVWRKHEHRHRKAFSCSVSALCSKRFANPRDLCLHEKSHRGDKDEVCPFCHAKFVHPSTLKKHVQFVHADHGHKELARPFICRRCSKRFARKESLQKHLGCHLKRRHRLLVRCDECDASFISTTNRNRHKRMLHRLSA